jgi:hypothetical protein
MFSHRQQRRRWSAWMLALWLFGLASGVAHACLPAGLPGQHGVASVASHCHPADQTDAASPVEQGTFERTNCGDFCDKASVSIPSLKSALDQLGGSVALLPAAAAFIPLPPVEPVQSWVPRREGTAAPAIRIAFLRLAL